ncbi:hypothetical protein D6T65_05290 [Arthrobacter frigidicola]|nr:hypothetical protein D6T65_05290 [Arthrobacter frigidicola]
MAQSKGSKQVPGGGPAPGARTITVILGGGVDARRGLDIPKQLAPIAGRTSLERTVDILSASSTT